LFEHISGRLDLGIEKSAFKIQMKQIKTLVILLATMILLNSVDVAAQAKKAVKQISGGIVNGKAVLLPKPIYPEDARKARMSGTVKVQVLIDESGAVVSANAISGLENVSLRLAAEEAAMRATFSPTKLSGQPVKVSGVIVYNFDAEKSNEERFRIMAIATFMSISRNFASDLKKFDEIFEGTNMFQEAVPEFPEFAKELKTLTSLERLTTDKRVEAIDNASVAIRAKLGPSDVWQFDVGKNFGELLGQFMQLVEVPGTQPDLTKLDESSIKIKLSKMKDLTYSAPSDFPNDVLEKMKTFVEMSERKDLMTPENSRELLLKMMSIIETISPA
jgi:TonB family protein